MSSSIVALEGEVLMRMKILCFCLVPFCQFVSYPAFGNENSVNISSQQLTALILVSEEMKKDNIIIENHNFKVEDQDTNIAVTVSEVPPLRKGGVVVYLVSKSERKIVSVKGQR